MPGAGGARSLVCSGRGSTRVSSPRSRRSPGSLRTSCVMGTNMSLLHQPFDPAREAALVTGAGNGIGRAIAQALVGEGVRTVFADVNPDTVAAAVKTSPRPELAVPFVGDLPAAPPAMRCSPMRGPRSGG